MLAHDALVAARYRAPESRLVCLQQADVALDQLRQYTLLACEWQWWSEAQYAHFSRFSADLGKLIVDFINTVIATGG